MKKIIFVMFVSIFFLNGFSKCDDLIFGKIEQKLDKKKVNDVKLSKVLLTPSLFKNSIIRFDAKFIRPGKLSRVFHTKYNLSEYLNFSVWPDEEKLWRKEGLKNFLPLAFVKKTSSKATVIGKLKKYQRIRIIALVTNDYQNNPWIEVLSIKVLEKEALSEDALYHIRLGDKYHYGDKPSVKTTDLNVVEDGNKNIGVSLLRAEIEYNKALTYNLGKVEKASVNELLAEVQLKQGKVDEAILVLTESLEVNENSGNGNHLMAQAYIKKNDLVQAKIYGEKALELLSKDKNVLLCNAKIQIGMKKYELAKLYCINALRLDSEDINIYSNLGLIYDQLGEYDVSKEMYRRAIHLTGGTDKFDLHKNMAHQLLKIGLIEKNKVEKNKALEEANRELDASIHQIFDKDPVSFYIWGRVLEEWVDHQNHFETAVEKFSKAIELKSDYYDAYIHKADILSKHLNKPEESMDSYEKASLLRPKELYPLQSVEGIYRNAKKYKKAVSVNERIVALDNKNFGAYFLLGSDNHKHLKNQEQALAWFMKAKNINPEHKSIDFYIGETLYLVGKYSEAIKSLLVSQKKMKNDKKVCYFLAKAYTDSRQTKNAISYLKKYIEMDSENIEIRLLLINEYLNNDKMTSNALALSKPTLELAVKNGKQVGKSRDNYGWSLVKSGQSQKALSVLEASAKELKTNKGDYHLAFVYVEQNLFEEAVSLVKKLKSRKLNKKLMSLVLRLESNLNRKSDKVKGQKKKDAVKKAKTEAVNSKKLKIEEDQRKKDQAKKDKADAQARKKQKELDRANKKKADKLAKQKAKVDKENADKKKKEDNKLAKQKSKDNKEKAAKQKKENEKIAKQKAKDDKENAAKKKKEDEKRAKLKAKNDKLIAEKNRKAKTEADKRSKEESKRALVKKKKNDKERVSKDKREKEAKKVAAKIAAKERKKQEKENAKKIELEKKRRQKIDKENAQKRKDAKKAEAKRKKEREKQAKKEKDEARKNAERAAKKREETLRDIERMKKKREKEAKRN